MRPNLTVVTLGVKDFRRSVHFYKIELGWKGKVMDDVAFFNLSGVVLALYPRHLLAKDVNVSSKGKGFPGFTLAHNARSEKEVDAIFIAVRKAGAKIVKTPQKVFWGGYSGYFADPDGFLWEVAYNSFWKLDKKGRVIP